MSELSLKLNNNDVDCEYTVYNIESRECNEWILIGKHIQ